MEKDKHLGLRIDAETHGKLKSLAEFDGRSINGEVLYLIRQAIMQKILQRSNEQRSVLPRRMASMWELKHHMDIAVKR